MSHPTIYTPEVLAEWAAGNRVCSFTGGGIMDGQSRSLRLEGDIHTITFAGSDYTDRIYFQDSYRRGQGYTFEYVGREVTAEMGPPPPPLPAWDDYDDDYYDCSCGCSCCG